MDLLKNIFFMMVTFFGFNVLNENPLKCVSMNNLECKIIPQIINISNLLCNILITLSLHPYS